MGAVKRGFLGRAGLSAAGWIIFGLPSEHASASEGKTRIAGTNATEFSWQMIETI